MIPRAESRPEQVAVNRMVVVDRQPLFLAAVGRLLAGPPLNARVEGMTDVQAAIRCLEEEPVVRLVLAEVTDEAEILVRAATGRSVPIVLLGEAGARPSPARALRAGASGLFHKDASPDEFLAGIAAVLAGHRALGSKLLQNLIDNIVEAPAGPGHNAAVLSPTEQAVLAAVARGSAVTEIARSRGISQKTVRKHLANVYRKLGVRSRSEAVLWALRARLLSVPEAS